MTPIEAFILGIVQGLTEFLPVSSSAHLTIAKRLLGIQSSEAMVYFDLLCHLGTLLAIIVVLWKEAWKSFTNFHTFSLFTLALVPLVPAYFLLKPLRALLAQDVGLFLICTAAFLFVASYQRKENVLAKEVAGPKRAREPEEQVVKWRDVLWIGVAQSLALLPGISRSGSTIATARLLGWEWKEAARFSFLLAIPTIIGGSLLETLRGAHTASPLPWNLLLIGFATSFAVGLGAVRLLFWILDRGTLRPFAWYCLAVGLFALVWLK